VGRILYFLKLQLDVSWEEEKLSAYRDKQLVRLGPLYQDEYLDVRLYAVENRRPKNRYTLVAIGRCTFRGSGYDDRRGDILELPYTYGCDVNCHGSRANIIQEFIHLPTIDDIKKFAEGLLSKVPRGEAGVSGDSQDLQAGGVHRDRGLFGLR